MSREEAPNRESGPSAASQAGKTAAFPIIGIGASAGGLEACEQLLNALPRESLGMALVFVMHLDPRHESPLPDILARASQWPTVEVQDGQVVEPDHVYVIPPHTTVTLAGGALYLAAREESRPPHLPIDQFFKSLASEHESGAIGVLLSGSGTDGLLGMEDIKAAGGFTLAQDEQSAKFAAMPQSAIHRGCVDQTLPPREIAEQLARMARHPYMAPEKSAGDTLAVDDDSQYRRLLDQLRHATGFDFRGYRDTTIRRRIMRRMVLQAKDRLKDYVDLAEDDNGELKALYQDILINVTSFFREPDTFEALKERVFPEMLANRSPGPPVRIWVPGCSTGQEAYTLAMVLLEYLEARNLRVPIRIFGTDLSDSVSLQKAREGLYPRNIEAEVTPERLRRFFTREDDKYRVIQSVRDLCVFVKQNVAADPPFSRVDLISCRNLLIYLAPPLQKRVLPTFHYALNPHGYLILGSTRFCKGGAR